MSRLNLIAIAILSITILVLVYVGFRVASATSIPFSYENASTTSTPPSYEVYVPAVLNLGQPMLSTPGPADIPILPTGGPGAATDLQSEVECEVPGKAVARLSWTVASIPGSEQRVDVTIFKDGFENGEFETSGQLPPNQSSLMWERLSPGLNHRWRVLTLQPDGWVPSETAIFKGPICAVDILPTPPIIIP